MSGLDGMFLVSPSYGEALKILQELRRTRQRYRLRLEVYACTLFPCPVDF